MKNKNFKGGLLGFSFVVVLCLAVSVMSFEELPSDALKTQQKHTSHSDKLPLQSQPQNSFVESGVIEKQGIIIRDTDDGFVYYKQNYNLKSLDRVTFSTTIFNDTLFAVNIQFKNK